MEHSEVYSYENNDSFLCLMQFFC